MHTPSPSLDRAEFPVPFAVIHGDRRPSLERPRLLTEAERIVPWSLPSRPGDTVGLVVVALAVSALWAAVVAAWLLAAA